MYPVSTMFGQKAGPNDGPAIELPCLYCSRFPRVLLCLVIYDILAPSEARTRSFFDASVSLQLSPPHNRSSRSPIGRTRRPMPSPPELVGSGCGGWRGPTPRRSSLEGTALPICITGRWSSGNTRCEGGYVCNCSLSSRTDCCTGIDTLQRTSRWCMVRLIEEHVVSEGGGR